MRIFNIFFKLININKIKYILQFIDILISYIVDGYYSYSLTSGSADVLSFLVENDKFRLLGAGRDC